MVVPKPSTASEFEGRSPLGDVLWKNPTVPGELVNSAVREEVWALISWLSVFTAGDDGKNAVNALTGFDITLPVTPVRKLNLPPVLKGATVGFVGDVVMDVVPLAPTAVVVRASVVLAGAVTALLVTVEGRLVLGDFRRDIEVEENEVPRRGLPGPRLRSLVELCWPLDGKRTAPRDSDPEKPLRMGGAAGEAVAAICPRAAMKLTEMSV